MYWVEKFLNLGKGKFGESDQRKKELPSVAGLRALLGDTLHGLTSDAGSFPDTLVADLRSHRPGLAVACLR